MFNFNVYLATPFLRVYPALNRVKCYLREQFL
jgi:hypothetical protein